MRGYGLVDSPKVQATPGRLAESDGVVAPNPRAAAQYYPAGYWASLLQIPEKSEFPGTGAEGQRDRAGHEDAGAVAGLAEERQLLHVPSDRQQGDT